MPHTTVAVTTYREGSTCFIPVNFNAKAVFGRIRAPVRGHAERLPARADWPALFGFWMMLYCGDTRRFNSQRFS